MFSIFRKDDEGFVPSSLGRNKGVRFHINSKEPRAVVNLLQRMFSNEFDIAEDDLMNVPISRPQSYEHLI